MKLVYIILVLLAFPLIIGFWVVPIGLIIGIISGQLNIGAIIASILLWIVCGAVVLGLDKLRRRLKK